MAGGQVGFRTIDWVAEMDLLNSERLARSQNSHGRGARFRTAARTWLVLAASGGLIGAIAVVITLATSWFADLREGYCSGSWYLNESSCCLGTPSTGHCSNWVEHPWWFGYPLYIILSVIFAFVASFSVVNVAQYAAGSGISEIKCIVSGFDFPEFLDAKTLLVKCLVLPLTIASGLSVGKEGPSVHYAACAGNVVQSKLLSARQSFIRRSDLLTACCAAGVAVAFGSPIGGVLFGIEEIASTWSIATVWRTYFCCFVATSTVALLNPFRNGQVVLFSVQYDGSWHLFELPFFVLLGLFGGLVGQLIIRSNLRISALRKRFWGAHAVSETLLLVIITASICYFNQYLRVDMTKSMQILFHECEHGGENHGSCDSDNKAGVMVSLIFACVVRFSLLLISYGAGKVPAGIFVPSLAVGALFGRLVGTFVWALYDSNSSGGYFSACTDATACVNPGTYALLGAGALLSGVMNITLTVVIILFELTGATHYIVPTMIVVGVTKLISSKIGHGGIADMAIQRNNLPFLEADPPDYHSQTAQDIMVPRSRLEVVESGTDYPENPKYREYAVVDAEDYVVGSMTMKKLNNSPIMVQYDDPLAKVHAILARLGPHAVFVTKEGHLQGMITRKTLLKAHSAEPLKFTAREELVAKNINTVLEKLDSLAVVCQAKFMNVYQRVAQGIPRRN